MARTLFLLVPILLITVVVALPGAHAFAFSFSATQPSSPCHGHTPAKQPAAPVNYQCCGGSHDAAVPSKIFSPRPLLTRPDDLDASPDVVLTGLFHSLLFVVPADSPPGLTPLRI